MLPIVVTVQPNVSAASSRLTPASMRIRFSVVPTWMRSAVRRCPTAIRDHSF
jgi:hypothetical protein